MSVPTRCSCGFQFYLRPEWYGYPFVCQGCMRQIVVYPPQPGQIAYAMAAPGQPPAPAPVQGYSSMSVQSREEFDILEDLNRLKTELAARDPGASVAPPVPANQPAPRSTAPPVVPAPTVRARETKTPSPGERKPAPAPQSSPVEKGPFAEDFSKSWSEPSIHEMDPFDLPHVQFREAMDLGSSSDDALVSGPTSRETPPPGFPQAPAPGGVPVACVCGMVFHVPPDLLGRARRIRCKQCRAEIELPPPQLPAGSAANRVSTSEKKAPSASAGDWARRSIDEQVDDLVAGKIPLFREGEGEERREEKSPVPAKKPLAAKPSGTRRSTREDGCPACGKDIVPGARFCPHCGAKQGR